MSDSGLHLVQLQIAPTADHSQPPWTWQYEDLNDPDTRPENTKGRFFDKPAAKATSGRQNLTAQTDPSTFAAALDNRDGHLTPPGHPESPWYPGIKQGMPIRAMVRGATSHLQLTGADTSKATIPHHADFEIPGDQFIGVEFAAPVWLNTEVAAFEVGGLWDAVEGSIGIFLFRDGAIALAWSEDGTFGTAQQIQSEPGAAARIAGGIAVAGAFDVDDGAGGHQATWYIGPSLDAILADPDAHTWGEPTVGPGTTSVHVGTADYEIGGLAGFGNPGYPGNVRRFVHIDGDATGTVVLDVDFLTQPEGTTSFVEGTGKTVTVTDAEITRLRLLRTWRTDSFKLHTPHGRLEGFGRTTISASGALRRLGRGRRKKPLASALTRVETAVSNADNMLAGWTLEDASGSASFASFVPGVAPMGFGGSVNLASATDLPASKPLPMVPGGQGFGYQGVVPPRTGLTDWRGTIFLHVPTLATTGEQEIFTLKSTGTVRTWKFLLDDATIRLVGLNAADAIVVDTGAGVATGWDEGWVQLTLGLTQNGGNVDWAQAWLTLGGTAPGSAGSVAGTLGRPTHVGGLFTAATDGIALGHLSVTTGLPAGWLGWVDGANNAYIGEKAGTRFLRLCREEGVYAVLHGNAADTPEMGPQRPLPFLTLLEECVTADGGMLTELAHHPGGLGMRTRVSMYNQQPAVVIDGGLVDPFAGSWDDTETVNVFTATRVDGSSHTHTDQASVDEIDIYDRSDEFNVETDLQLGDIAAWHTHLGTSEDPRFGNATVLLTAVPELIDAFLDLAPGDVARVENLPAEYLTPSVDLLVQGDEHTIAPARWEVNLNATAAAPWTGGVLDDTTRRIDSAGSELGAPVDADDTSWTVDSPGDEPWVDTAAFPDRFPFDWMVAGEKVTVTAIVGTTSPQTATVVRSVNGITKSHPAGTPVHAADRIPILR